MFTKRKNTELPCYPKKLCSSSNREMDEFPSTSMLLENETSNHMQNKIELQNPLELIAQRKKEDEMNLLYNSNETAVKCLPTEQNMELQELLAAIGSDSQEGKINMFPPGKHTFISTHLFCMFSKDTIPGKDDLSKLHRQGIVLLLSSGGRSRKDILHIMFQNGVWSSHEVNSMYDYIFFLISVHEDENLVTEGTISLIGATSWYPTVDSVRKVLVNWGASITDSVSGATESLQSSDPELVFKGNCKQILKLIGRKAELIMQKHTEEKQCLLLKNIAECALDVHFIYSHQEMFRECFMLLVNAIPEHQWNTEKVEMICSSLFTGEHVHNLHYLCSEMLMDCSRCTSLERYLANMTVHEMLGLHFNDNILDVIVKSKPLISTLNAYQLFIMIQLVFLVTKREREEGSNMNFQKIMDWFKNLRFFVKNLPQQGSVDSAVLHELITRCVSYWRIELMNAGMYE